MVNKLFKGLKDITSPGKVSLPGVTMVSLQSVESIAESFELERGLMESSILPWTPQRVSSLDVLETVEREAPTSEEDVVEWMQKAAAQKSVLDGMCREYKRAGSRLLSDAGDGYIPGVSVGDLETKSISGYSVRDRDYGTVKTPRGDFDVPSRGKTTFAKGDILAWGALPDPGYGCQWTIDILQWRDLAGIPIDTRIRFASCDGLTAPNFFDCASTVPSPVATYTIGLTSDKPQTLKLRGRGRKGSYGTVIFKDDIDIPEGESEIRYNIAGFPASPQFTMQLQPEDGTKAILDYLRVIP